MFIFFSAVRFGRMTKREKDRLQAVRQEMKGRSPSKLPPDAPVDLSYFSVSHPDVKTKLGGKIKKPSSKTSASPVHNMQHSGLLSTVDRLDPSCATRLNLSPVNGAIQSEAIAAASSPSWSIQRMLQDSAKHTRPNAKDISNSMTSTDHSNMHQKLLFPASQTLQYLAKQPSSQNSNSPQAAAHQDSSPVNGHYIPSQSSVLSSSGSSQQIDKSKVNGLSPHTSTEYAHLNGLNSRSYIHGQSPVKSEVTEPRQPEITYSSLAHSLDQHFAKSLASLYAKRKSPLPNSINSMETADAHASSESKSSSRTKTKSSNGLNGTRYTQQFHNMKDMWEMNETTANSSSVRKNGMHSSSTAVKMEVDATVSSPAKNGIHELGITPEGAELVQDIVDAYHSNIESQRNNLERILLAAIQTCLPESDNGAAQKSQVRAGIYIVTGV